MKRVLEQLYRNMRLEIKDDDGAFLPFYLRLVETVKKVVAAYCETNGIEAPELDGELVKAMTEQLRKVSLRTLILEMNLAERCGELDGLDDVEKYKCFSQDKLADELFLGEVYENYPELRRALFQELDRMVENIISVLEAFAQDREEINEMFFPGTPCHRIGCIGGGTSDGHNGGKRVYWIILDNGDRLVYKPRSLAADNAFKGFVGRVSELVGVEYRWNAVLDKTGYGWCAWVTKRTCQTRKQLENYYFRNGLLLCVTYLLGSEDMHYENMIADGEYPVLVDLEMALGHRGESVLHTGLLPLYAWNQNGEGVNVGAMNGSGGQLCPIMMPVVVDAGSAKMHIEYRQPMMAEGKNLATLNGEFIEPYMFLEQIQAGFEVAYLAIEREKKMFIGVLDGFSQVPVRYLIRETQQYAMMLNSSYHPQFLMDSSDRREGIRHMNRGEKSVQEEMAKEKKVWSCIQEEDELFEGDVPYFWCYVQDRALHSGTGEKYADYFKQSITEKIKNRLQRMSESDLRRQQRFIRNALFMGTKKATGERISTEGYVAESCGAELFVMEDRTDHDGLWVAEQVGDILLEEAIWSEDGKNVDWISIVMAGYQERGYLMRPMGYYLYDGLAGVAVFMAGLVKESHSKRFDHAYEVLIQQLFAYTDRTIQDKGLVNLPTGAYAGEASVMYTYLLLYERTGEEQFLVYLRKHSDIVLRCLKNDRIYDVLGGNAGAALVMLKSYALTGERRYLNLAAEAGDELIKSAITFERGVGWVNNNVGKALTGFAHGTGGLILALCKLGYYTGKEVYHDYAHKAFLFEQQHFMAEIDDWADLRFEDHKQEAGETVWCHGRGGILAACSEALKYAEAGLRQELKKTIKKVNLNLESRQGTAYCLCHGELGTVGLLHAVGQREEAQKLYRKLMKELRVENGDELRKMMPLQECENFGLMGGLAGIGYGCLEGAEKVMELLVI